MNRMVATCLVGLIFGLGACSTAHRAEDAAHDATHPTVNAVGIDRPEKEGLRGAVAAPLEDVNVIRDRIPPVLLNAMEAPYARPDPPSCKKIGDYVRDLDDALGDDLDANEPEDSNPKEKRGRQAGETMVLAVRDTAEDFIPFRSWVRRLSGAQAHANVVRAAVYAGRERRSYLKGLGEALGCRYPAGPKGASPLPVKLPARKH